MVIVCRGHIPITCAPGFACPVEPGFSSHILQSIWELIVLIGFNWHIADEPMKDGFDWNNWQIWQLAALNHQIRVKLQHLPVLKLTICSLKPKVLLHWTTQHVFFNHPLLIQLTPCGSTSSTPGLATGCSGAEAPHFALQQLVGHEGPATRREAIG